MNKFILVMLTFVGTTMHVPVNAQYYNGYGGGDYFGPRDSYPPSNIIQPGNGYGDGDYFGPQRRNPNQYQNSPNYGGLRDCSKYINC